MTDTAPQTLSHFGATHAGVAAFEATQIESPKEDAFAVNCVFHTIIAYLMPYLLEGAGDDPVTARAAVLELIDAYNAATVRELTLAGRIIAFNLAALDNMRRSMLDPAMSDAMVLRLRGNAVALNRAADQGQKALELLQAQRRASPDAAVTPSSFRAPSPIAPAMEAPSTALSQASPVRARTTDGSASGPADPDEAGWNEAVIEVVEQKARAMFAMLPQRTEASGMNTASLPDSRSPGVSHCATPAEIFAEQGSAHRAETHHAATHHAATHHATTHHATTRDATTGRPLANCAAPDCAVLDCGGPACAQTSCGMTNETRTYPS